MLIEVRYFNDGVTVAKIRKDEEAFEAEETGGRYQRYTDSIGRGQWHATVEEWTADILTQATKLESETVATRLLAGQTVDITNFV